MMMTSCLIAMSVSVMSNNVIFYGVMSYGVQSNSVISGFMTGVQCPHRGAVFSYTWRHRAYPYEAGDREACNVFFVWEMLRPLLKGRRDALTWSCLLS